MDFYLLYSEKSSVFICELVWRIEWIEDNMEPVLKRPWDKEKGFE